MDVGMRVADFSGQEIAGRTFPRRESRRLPWPPLSIALLAGLAVMAFRPDIVVAAAATKRSSAIDGSWLGGSSKSHGVQLSIRSDRGGKESCTLDALAQRAFGLPCANVVFSNNHLSFGVPSINAHWSGALSSDEQTLTGTWNQGRAIPLTFHREARAIAPPRTPKISFQPPMPPVAAAEMPTVLRADLRRALQAGALASGTDTGITVGVVRDGVQRVFSLGTARPDSIYEIGSITKTFTGLVLAQMIEQHKVQLDEPVRELLPADTVARPAGAEITLLDLITHHSGLPRMPDNLGADPADYSVRDLYAFMARHGVAKAANAPFLYSNLGVAILGQGLAHRASTSYAKLVDEDVILPLGLRDTALSLTAAARRRLIQGHNAQHRPIKPWGLNAFAPTGSIHSTAGDMLTYLLANLHPQALPSEEGEEPAERTLSAALKLSHELRADAAGPLRIAFAWFYNPATGDFLDDGVTDGYCAYAFFNPKGNYAAVVLMNTTAGPSGSFADRVGTHISQRFAGKPALSLFN